MEADAYAMDLDGVAVDDACDADDRRGRSCAGHGDHADNADCDDEPPEIANLGQAAGFVAVNNSGFRRPVSLRSRSIFGKVRIN